jgi:AraC-like DNA-binding protein
MTGSPDVLSDVLRWARLRGIVQGRMDLSAPWGLAVPAGDEACFYVVARGACWIEGEDVGEPRQLSAGDLLFLPRGRQHALKDAPRTRARPGAELLGVCVPALHATVHRGGGGGAATHILAGRFAMEGPAGRRLQEALPACIHIAAHSRLARGLAVAQDEVCEEIETPGPGTLLLIDRLADVLLVRVLRHYMTGAVNAATTGADADAPEHSWLTALVDPKIGRALSVMHANPEKPWTVTTLAREAGQSRSGFATRFRAAVGQSPMDYLARWRVEVGADLLVHEDLTVGEAAARVGYETDAAFTRVFKRQFGTPPARYRRQRAQSSTSGARSASSRGTMAPSDR